MRIAAGEIGARGAVVGHEQRVADERRIADHVGQVRRCVARHMQRDQRDAAERQLVAVVEQEIELRSVTREVAAFVEHFAEDVLHREDLGVR